MKPTSPIILLSFALGVFADLSTIESILTKIEDDAFTLGNEISAYSGGSATQIENESDTLISDIKSGTSTIAAQPQLSNTDALALAGFVEDLIKNVTKTVDDVVHQKHIFEENCYGPTILDSLEAQYSAANDLSDALTGIVPSNLAPIAQGLAASVTSAIKSGISVYTDVTSCSTGTSATTTTTTTASASSSASTSTTTAASTSRPTSSAKPASSTAPASASAPATTSPAPTSGAGSGTNSSGSAQPSTTSTFPGTGASLARVSISTVVLGLVAALLL